MTTPRSLPIELPPQPPGVPRALTPAVRRRSLVEPRVRFWWLAGIALGLVAVYLLISQLLERRQEEHVIQDGSSVSATVVSLGEGEIHGNLLTPDYPVTLDFDFNGRSYEVTGHLDGRVDPIAMKEVVPIKVDPNNPEHWTYRTEAPPLMRAVLASLLVLPFALAGLIVAAILRRRVLATWTRGVAGPFIVEGVGQSALAPASWVVHCKPADGQSARLVHVFIPRQLAHPRKGEVLWLIHPPGKPSAAVAAMAYG